MPYILGVRIDSVTRNQAIQRVEAFISSKKQHMICTPNPEMLVAAHRDQEFLKILNSSSLNICDGKGIQLMAREQMTRIAGIDFIHDMCANAEKRCARVYIVGGAKKIIAKRAAQYLLREFPMLKLVGSHEGPAISKQQDRGGIAYTAHENEVILKDIRAAAPDILFVGFGHEKQEYWIQENLKKLPSVRVAMGVGGSFDVFSGRLRRAPNWMRRTGFEWLWRLLLEPKRLWRIIIAVCIFPILCFRYR